MEQKMTTAFKVFDEVRLQGEHTDVTLRVYGQDFKVHKIILCGCSPFFTTLFRWTKTDGQDCHDIPGISPDTMALVIGHAYSRPVHITEENVSELLVAADRFLISSLVDTCCKFLEENLSLMNCISTCMLTEHFYSCSNLHQKAKIYILQHFEEVQRVSEEFLQLSLQRLEELIAQDELNVSKEELVFESIIHWIEYAPEDRRKHIAVLLSKVRMGLLSPSYLMNDIKNNALVLENEACSSIIVNAMKAIFDLHMDEPVNYDLLYLHTRVRLPSEILLAIGGWSTGSPTNGIEAYDTKADCWIDVTQGEEHPRAYHGTAFLDGFVYCVGGFDSDSYFSSVRKFNPVTQSWHEVAPMHERRCYVSIAVLDDFLYAIGGFNGQSRLKTAERYDIKTNQWTMIAPMHEQRSDASATSLNGKIYICGGFTGVECLFTAECYNPETNQWSLIAPMRSRRSGIGVVTYRNRIYAVGGFDGHSRLQSAEAYSPNSDSWHNISPMINQRSNFGIEVLDDHLFVAGGFDGRGTCSNVESYDLETNEWDEASDMNFSRSALSCCVISGLPDVSQYVTDRDTLQALQDQESD